MKARKRQNFQSQEKKFPFIRIRRIFTVTCRFPEKHVPRGVLNPASPFTPRNDTCSTTATVISLHFATVPVSLVCVSICRRTCVRIKFLNRIETIPSGFINVRPPPDQRVDFVFV